MTRVRCQRTETADRTVPLPAYATSGAAGADVRANFPDRRPVTLAPGARAAIPTGLRFEIPPGHEEQVRPRSGLALRHGVTVANAPGTVDADYRGEVGVVLVNLGRAPFVIEHGSRIAQIVIAPVTAADFEETAALESTGRGPGGFGSTGVG